MHIEECFAHQRSILMEGALGERLKREYHLPPDDMVALARHIYHPLGRAALRELWLGYAGIAKKYGLPFLATTPTRRANRERVARAGLGGEIILDNVKFLRMVQQETNTEMYAGGMMGCKGDAYTGQGALGADAARVFHRWQADLFRQAGVDFLYAALMPTLPEAAGMAQAMEQTDLPYIISFTIQGDGKLIDGTVIADAIQFIDASVRRPPLCYMTNCVHPQIVLEALSQPCNDNALVRQRFLGIQANTSPLPYGQLDNAVDLKGSAPEPFAQDMIALRAKGIKLFGGCCGTDDRHMEQIAKRL